MYYVSFVAACICLYFFKVHINGDDVDKSMDAVAYLIIGGTVYAVIPWIEKKFTKK